MGGFRGLVLVENQGNFVVFEIIEGSNTTVMLRAMSFLSLDADGGYNQSSLATPLDFSS